MAGAGGVARLPLGRLPDVEEHGARTNQAIGLLGTDALVPAQHLLQPAHGDLPVHVHPCGHPVEDLGIYPMGYLLKAA